MEKYRNAEAAIEQRVEDLLPRMTIEEKIAQLGSCFADVLLDHGVWDTGKAREVLAQGIGHISAIARSSALAPRELAGLANNIQRYLIEQTRLSIPAIIHEECLNGFRARGATIFPQNIGLASTWDTGLLYRITGAIRHQMRAVGVHQGLAPVLDVARDPRWGRTEETFGEDPYLVAEMGIAYIRGLQGDNPAKGIAATVKHFAGHGLPEGGLNCAPSHIPPRLLRDVYLYPFEKAVRQAGVFSLMNAYHELDGIPCGASVELLTHILRDEWGFSGPVVSDYYAISQLVTVHHICEDAGEAAVLALTAGIDVELPKTHGFARPLKEKLDRGEISVSLIDRAVSRILALKFKLGIFDNPYIDAGNVIEIDTEANRALALEAAQKSIILLKNSGILPLSKSVKSIAVIGPNADSARNMLGDYTYPAGEGYEISTNPDTGSPEVLWKESGKTAVRYEPEIITVLEGIKRLAAPDVSITYTPGCDIQGDALDGFGQAVDTARRADVAVVVVGGISAMFPEGTSGEMRDSMTLELPGVQEELVTAVSETGTPVVLVIISGRPHVLGNLVEKAAAIMQAWLPGEEGGRAIAGVLFGDYNPGGRLPVSLPVHAGQIPVYYGHKPSGGRSSIWGDYIDGPVKPLFEFGFGFSYTTFDITNLKIKPGIVGTDGKIEISAEVKNTGKRPGDEVIQLYIQDVVASITRPVKELKGFARISLQPGERRTVTFVLPAAECPGFERKPLKCLQDGIVKLPGKTVAFR